MGNTFLPFEFYKSQIQNVCRNPSGGYFTQANYNTRKFNILMTSNPLNRADFLHYFLWHHGCQDFGSSKT